MVTPLNLVINQERGVNADTLEASGRTPNKLNTNELQRKDLADPQAHVNAPSDLTDIASPSGLSGPPGSIDNTMPKDGDPLIVSLVWAIFNKANEIGYTNVCHQKPTELECFYAATNLTYKRSVPGAWNNCNWIKTFYSEYLRQKQSKTKDNSGLEEVDTSITPSDPKLPEVTRTPRDKAISYAKAFVEKEQVRGRPGYDGPGLFEDDYEALIDLTVAGTMFDGHRNEEKYGWIWTKYYPILDDPKFLDLIGQCKSNPEEMDLSEF